MKTEVVEKLASLITAAFGIVAALAWNDVIRALFVGPCGTENAGALCYLSAKGPVVYALLVTILAVIITIWIGKVAEKVKILKIPRKKTEIAEAKTVTEAASQAAKEEKKEEKEQEKPKTKEVVARKKKRKKRT